MKLFHGSDTVVRGPLANLGRAKVRSISDRVSI